MKLKLAGSTKTKKTITDQDVLKALEAKKDIYYYFDESNADKDILKLKDMLEDADYSVYLREATYNLDENYVYEMHII